MKIEKGVNYKPLEEFIEHILQDEDFSEFMDKYYEPNKKKKYYAKLEKQLTKIKSSQK